MNKYRLAPTRKYNVRCSGERLDVQPKPETCAVKIRAQTLLRSCVARSYRAHASASLLRCHRIHGQPSRVTEFLLEPFQCFTLIFNSCPPELAEKPSMRRRLLDEISSTLITCTAQRTKVDKFVFAAVAAILDVADVQPDFAAGVKRIGISCACSAHLTRIAVTLNNLSTQSRRQRAS